MRSGPCIWLRSPLPFIEMPARAEDQSQNSNVLLYAARTTTCKTSLVLLSGHGGDLPRLADGCGQDSTRPEEENGCE